MKWRLAFLLALALPELALAPARADLGPGWPHLLGTDALGRDGLARLLLAGARSLGFATAVSALALLCALPSALRGRGNGSLGSALRSLPPLLVLLPLAAVTGGLGWTSLALLLALLLAPHLEAPLRARLEPFRRSSARAQARVMGLSPLALARSWAPWVAAQAAPLFPSAWLGALWTEATLRLLGLGPGPERDSLGLLLQEELPRLATDPSPLGLAALALVLLLAASASKPMRKDTPWTP